jgi:drug/metabolite transporter (DMT)-like permease
MRVGAAELGTWPVAFVRVGIAALCLWPWLLWRPQVGLGALLRTHWRALLGVGLLNSALPFACYAFAVQHISTGLSAILNATTPLFGALVAWLWLRDALSPLRLLGLVLGFAGVAALVSGQLALPHSMASATATAASTSTALAAEALASRRLWAVLACLLATLCYALSASLTQKHLKGMPPLLVAAASLTAASLALAVPAFIHWPDAAISPRAWLALLLAGALCTGLALFVYFRLIARLGSARTATVTFLIPVFALGFGVIFLNETITLPMLLWAAVVMLGTALSSGLIKAKPQP